MAKIILIVLFSLLVVGDCKKRIVDSELEQSPIDSTTIMPLKIGNIWSYKVTRLDISRNVDTVLTYHRILTSSIIINNERWYDDSGGYIYTNKPGGLWKAINDDTNYFALYPAKVNDKFPIWLDTAVVISTDSLIEVPAGKYRCYVYKASYSTRFFSPGIGLIYGEEFYNSAYSDDFYLKWELTSYLIK